MYVKIKLQWLKVMVVGIVSLGFVANVHAQSTVTGTVTDQEDDSPLPGVNIILEGTTTGTTTNMDGEYEIDVPNLNETLEFSFVGYMRQTVSIDGRSVVNVEMQPGTVVGEEMVVTAFGIERETRGLTFSTQDIEVEDITKAREMNIVNSLQGKVAGLVINTSGTGVGSSSRVVLRGNRSISGDSQPLYVVDGVPVRGGISNMSPDEIATIDVLKGPNAAALYGSAAQNGAIVVTTHTGNRNETTFSLSNTFMMDSPMIGYQYQNEYGQGSGGSYLPSSEFSWGPRMEGQMVDHWSPNSELSGTQLEFSPQPNNVSDAFQTGYNQSTNLIARLGGENTSSVFSYTLTNGQGVLPGNELGRHNLSARINSDLTDRISLDGRVAYTRQSINNQLSIGGNFRNPSRHIYRMPRNMATDVISNFEYTTPQGENRQHFWNPGSNGGANPYWTLNRNLKEHNLDRVTSMASVTYDFADNLSLMVRGAYDVTNADNETRLYNDTYIVANFGSYEQGRSNSNQFNGDFILTYNDNIMEDWDFNINFGGNLKRSRNSSLNSNTGPSLIVPNFFTLSNTLNPGTSHSIGSPSDIQSLYSFGQISWRNSIFLDITGRNDWSSTLPADNRSYFYPSVGLSAILNDLFAMPEAISLARFRASYAQVGSSAGAFQLTRSASLAAGGNHGFVSLSGTLPNENLRPEMTNAYETGIDLRFYEGRLGLDLTVYQTNTTDQLFTIALPVGSGASQFYTNGGDVENKGLEILVTGNPVQTQDFRWDLSTNFGLNRNMVVEIDDERPRLTIGSDFLRETVIEEGEPFGQIYSRGFERDDQGRVLIGSDGMPLLTPGKTVQVANINPDFMAGLSNSFSYKDFTASFLIDHRQGGTMASFTQAVIYADGVTKQTLVGREGGAVFGTDIFEDETAVMESDGSPNTTAVNAEDFWRGVGGRNAPIGEAFVDSATNTRLRELTIGYNLPQSLISGLGIRGANFSLVGRNLFFIYKASDNLDPDHMFGTGPGGEGYDSFNPPTARSFGANLNIDF